MALSDSCRGDVLTSVHVLIMLMSAVLLATLIKFDSVSKSCFFNLSVGDGS